MTVLCKICGQPVEATGKGHRREYCYGGPCAQERERRRQRRVAARKGGGGRTHGGGYGARCAVCGEPPHEGRVCHEARSSMC